MNKIMKKRSKKAGLSPGMLIHIGEKKIDKPKITIIDYDEQSYQTKEAKSIEDCFPFRDTSTVTWINVDGLHEVDIIKKLGEHFRLHPLIMEDILNTDHRPKMEDFENYIYVVLKMLNYDEKNDNVATEQISLIIGHNFVISFQETVGDIFDPIRDRIRNGKGRIRKMSSDYLAYALMDAIIDNYFIILEKVGEKVSFLEEELIKNPKRETMHTIHNLKREIILLRKSVWPLREVISNLERSESSLVKENTKLYLRDVYDHTIHIIDTVETLRDILSGMIDIYLSSVSNKMNEVMKMLTIIATIFIPLTFVTGIYGMNFEYMPGIEWHVGFFAILFFMIAVSLSMLYYFRKKEWI